MNNINRLSTKNSDGIFIDMNGKSWRKIRSKGYVVMGEDETLVSTATLLSDDHGCYNPNNGIKSLKKEGRKG